MKRDSDKKEGVEYVKIA